MSFRDSFTGDAVTNTGIEYSPIYWPTLCLVSFVLVSLIVFCTIKKIPYKVKQNVLIGIAIFQIFFEIFWRIIFIVFKGATFTTLWPMYPCNLGGIIVPIICLLNSKKGKDLFYVFAFVGACLSFALPGTMYSFDFMAFPLLKSALQHTGILIIPAMEYAMGKYKTSIKEFPLLFVGCLIHFLNCEGIDEWLGLDPTTNDYMYLRQGYPFEIPGIPSPFVTITFALIIFAILLFVLGPRESINEVKKWANNIKLSFTKKEANS